jgi:hypothetical protein
VEHESPLTAPTTYRYTLTWQDALAYERLPKELPGLQKITLYIWLGLAGLLLVALPPEVVGDENTPRFWLSGAALVLIQYLIFFVLRAIIRLNRARYRFPAPTEFVVIEEPDRLLVNQAGKATIVPFMEIRALLPTAHHLFIAAGKELIIMPMGAFSDPTAMAQLVDRIDYQARDRSDDEDPAPAAPSTPGSDDF